MKQVTHLYIQRHSPFGAGTVHTTLCSRAARHRFDKDGGLNITRKVKEVTCKHCVKLIDKARNIKKYLDENPTNQVIL